jgi:LysR family glycine cleavage system transcriptional activator
MLDPGAPPAFDTCALSFWEEGQAIEATIAGQGIAILGDVSIANELASGTLVKAVDLPLPGFGFYLAHLSDHPRRLAIEAFSAWIRSLV